MKRFVKSLSVEVEHPDGSGTLVIREPLGAQRSAYVAGSLPWHVAQAVLEELGLIDAHLRAASGMDGDAPVSSRPARSRPAASRPSSRRSFRIEDAAPKARLHGAAEAMALLLDELTHAVVRAGRLQPTSTVDELLERAWLAAANNLQLARVLARLEDSLAPGGTALHAALAVAALSEMAERIRGMTDPTHDELTGPTLVRPFETCELLELGRRRERGAVRAETRMLVDLASGELLCESSGRGGSSPSRGPVGRHLCVTLGRRVPAMGYSRIHIQHYEYDPAPSNDQLEHVCHLASSGIPALSAGGLELVASPRPVFVQVRSLEGGSPSVVCLGGTAVRLDDGACPGVVQALFEQTRVGARVDALAGTLELSHRPGSESGLVFVPWSVILGDSTGRRLMPLSY